MQHSMSLNPLMKKEGLHLNPPAYPIFHLIILLEKFSYDPHLQWSTNCRKCKAFVLSWVAYRQTFPTVLCTEHSPLFLRLWTTLYPNWKCSTFWHLMATIQKANTSPNFLSEESKYIVDHWDKCCNFCCDFVQKQRLFYFFSDGQLRGINLLEPEFFI